MQGEKDQIEAAMAEMAVAQLSSRVPSLFDHYIGFEINRIEDDGSRAFGLLGFAIRETELYIPAIFLSGRIKGTETMNVASTGRFVSCTRSWVDYLAENSRSNAAGTPDAGAPNRRTSSHLEVYRSPGYAFSGKFASMSPEAMMSCDMGGGTWALDVPAVLKLAGRGGWEDFASLAASDEAVAEAMFRHYGERAFEIPGIGPSVRRKSAADLVGTAAPAQPEKVRVKIFVSADDKAAKSLSAKEKVDLATTGIAIVDERPRGARTRLVRSVSPGRSANPNSPGVYTVLSSDGLEPAEAVLVPSPAPVEEVSRPMPGTLAVEAKSGQKPRWTWRYSGQRGSLDRSRIAAFQTSDDPGEAFAEWISDSGPVKPSEARVGSVYFAARLDGGAATTPFEVLNRVNGRILVRSAELTYCGENLDDHRTNFSRARSHPSHVARDRKRVPVDDPSATTLDGVWLEGSDGSGVSPVSTGSRTVLPSTWALVEVASRNMSESPATGGPPKGPEWRGIASVSEIEAATEAASPHRKNASFPGHSRLFVANDGSGAVDVRWRGRRGLYRKAASAVAALVGHVGLGESDARSLVEKALGGGTAYDGWARPPVKEAAAIDIPWPDDMPVEDRTEYSGTRIVLPTAQLSRGVFEGYHDPARDLDPALSNYNAVAGRTISGGGVAGIVSRAAQSGIKQVFDMAVASFLTRGGRLGIHIQEDILPHLEAGLDRACRLVLRFYWNNDEFADLYGTEGMAEFEDIMLSNIRETGKAVLFLKRRGGNASSTYDDLNSLSEE